MSLNLIIFFIQAMVIIAITYGGVQVANYVSFECEPQNARRNLGIVISLYPVVLFSAVMLTEIVKKFLFGI